YATRWPSVLPCAEFEHVTVAGSGFGEPGSTSRLEWLDAAGKVVIVVGGDGVRKLGAARQLAGLTRARVVYAQGRLDLGARGRVGGGGGARGERRRTRRPPADRAAGRSVRDRSLGV